MSEHDLARLEAISRSFKASDWLHDEKVVWAALPWLLAQAREAERLRRADTLFCGWCGTVGETQHLSWCYETTIADLRTRLAEVERERDDLKQRNARQAATLSFTSDSTNVTMDPKYADELEAKAQRLDLAEARIRTLMASLEAALYDDAKYPQLRLPGMQRQRLRAALDQARGGT